MFAKHDSKYISIIWLETRNFFLQINKSQEIVHKCVTFLVIVLAIPMVPLLFLIWVLLFSATAKEISWLFKWLMTCFSRTVLVLALFIRVIKVLLLIHCWCLQILWCYIANLIDQLSVFPCSGLLVNFRNNYQMEWLLWKTLKIL